MIKASGIRFPYLSNLHTSHPLVNNVNHDRELLLLGDEADFDEIWGTPSMLFGAVPDKLWARSAQKRQREREPKFFFCPLNDARFHRLPVSHISRNLHKKTCFRVFGKHL